MKINKNLLSLGFTLVAITMLILPSMVQRAMIQGNGNGDDDDSFLLMTPPTPPSESNNTFPDDSFTYIIDHNFIEGDNATGYENNLTELMYDDGNKYEIQGEEGMGGYYFNIEFLFDVDLNNYLLEYYDLFLYLQIDVSFISMGTVYFQAFSNNNWVDITEITNQNIEINKFFLTKTTKFRLYASDGLKIASQKIISIDSLYFLISHKGNTNEIQLNGNTDYNILAQQYNWNQHPIDYYYCNIHPDWWVRDHPSEIIEQHTWSTVDSIQRGIWLGLEIEMDLNPYWNQDHGLPDLYVTNNYLVYSYADPYANAGWDNRIQAILYLWNYQTTNWEETHNYNYLPNGNNIITSHWEIDETDIDKYISNNKWRYKVYFNYNWVSYFYYGGLTLRHHVCYADLKYDFPQIEDIYTNPSSPLNTLEHFEIKTDLSDHIFPIETVQYYIEDWNTEWQSMEKIASHTWKNSDILDASDFPNGQYTVWINATDEIGISTCDYYIFEVSNACPRIDFIKPKGDSEKIDQLYNYNVNISIYEEEGDNYEDPEILIYKDNISEPNLDWTVMEQNSIGNPPLPSILHYWNYSFDPIDYENGLYKIIIKTNDSRQVIYNETLINILNNPPSIEILQPAISELITPMEWLIECNITNEDPINTAQWDIVPNLNANFTWKDLTYNITTEYWEGNFSILNYEYGDYYLIINATDDKYNSSIETQSLSFHPLITYNIDEWDISYNDNGINVYSNELVTTDILAQIDILHHLVANERDFEIYLPEKFDDAYNYYINRGFTKYEPLGFFPEGIYTEWQLFDYQSIDTVFFNLEKPKVINSLIEEDDDDVVTMEFTLSSKHAFTNIHIENELTKYFSDPDNYVYTLYYLYMGKWHEVDDYDVEPEVFPEFSFTWTDIGEDSVISFKFKAEPIETEPSNVGGYITFAFGGLAIACVPTQIYFLAKKKYKPKEEDGWGLTKYILITIALGVGGFIAGWIGGWLIYG